MMEFNPSFIQRLVNDTIDSFPKDAHLKLESHFDDFRDDSKSLDFRRAWSKSLVKENAFGKSSSSLEVVKARVSFFAGDFISNLKIDDEGMAKMIQSTTKYLDLVETKHKRNKDSNQHNADDTNSHMCALYELEREIWRAKSHLKQIQENLCNQAPRDEEFLVSDELVMACRAWARKVRWTWDRAMAKKIPLDLFDLEGFGEPSCESGHANLKSNEPHTTAHIPLHTSTLSNATIYQNVDKFIGLRIPHKEVIYARRGYCTFQLLNLAASTGEKCVYPAAIRIERGDRDHHLDPMTSAGGTTPPSLLFVFENPRSRRLGYFLGDVLLTQVHYCPAILQAWCAQLASWRRLLKGAWGDPGLELVTFPSPSRGVHVRRDGRLLLGHTLVEQRRPRPHEGASSSGGGNYTGGGYHSSRGMEEMEASNYDHRISLFVHELLSSVLCLSRHLVLPACTNEGERGGGGMALGATTTNATFKVKHNNTSSLASTRGGVEGGGGGGGVEEVIHISEGSSLYVQAPHCDFHEVVVRYQAEVTDPWALHHRWHPTTSSSSSSSASSSLLSSSSNRQPMVGSTGAFSKVEMSTFEPEAGKNYLVVDVTGDWRAVAVGMRTGPRPLPEVLVHAQSPGRVWVQFSTMQGDADHPGSPQQRPMGDHFLNILAMKSPATACDLELIELRLVLEEAIEGDSLDALWTARALQRAVCAGDQDLLAPVFAELEGKFHEIEAIVDAHPPR